MRSFSDLLLQPTTYAALGLMNIHQPTPVQVESIPALLAGRDLVGQSATGSGKTLAYGIPLVERVARKARVAQALVLVPTRELAVQVNAVLSQLASSRRRLSTALLVGGRPYASQISALRYGAQIVIGTPGRVKDHLQRGSLALDSLRMCVLDEADQMLDIGFAPDVEEILAMTPDMRQVALFSATMPDWVSTLAEKFLKDPLRVVITPADGEQSTIEQIAYQVPQGQKIEALCALLRGAQGERSLVFGRTKYGVERLGEQLNRLGFTVGTLHGNKSQRAREDVLTAFRRGQVQTLLATNVAARGLDIHDVYQVINYELPESSDLFTHRVGRTGRMGRQGKAITLLVPSEFAKWRRMARTLGQTVTVQRLALDESNTVSAPLARPESAVVREQHDLREETVSERKQLPAQRTGQPRPAASGPWKRPQEQHSTPPPELLWHPGRSSMFRRSAPGGTRNEERERTKPSRPGKRQSDSQRPLVTVPQPRIVGRNVDAGSARRSSAARHSTRCQPLGGQP
jgi:ATP-dependent RNA helicase DeaD